MALGFADVEAVGVGADLGAEVDLGGVVDLVADHAAVLIDDEGEGGGERGEEVGEGGEEVGAKLGGDELVGHGADQHHGGGEGGVGGEQSGGGGGNFVGSEHFGSRSTKVQSFRNGCSATEVEG